MGECADDDVNSAITYEDWSLLDTEEICPVCLHSIGKCSEDCTGF